jgi:hypothetical protein
MCVAERLTQAARFGDASAHVERDGSKPMSAGPLKCQDLPSYCLRKLDERELTAAEQVVFAAFVDDPYKVVLRCSSVWDDLIDLSQHQRCLVSGVLQAQREVLRQTSHSQSK